jgi:hypothetical protein
MESLLLGGLREAGTYRRLPAIRKVVSAEVLLSESGTLSAGAWEGKSYGALGKPLHASRCVIERFRSGGRMLVHGMCNGRCKNKVQILVSSPEIWPSRVRKALADGGQAAGFAMA